jgi:hypothetical protein
VRFWPRLFRFAPRFRVAKQPRNRKESCGEQYGVAGCFLAAGSGGNKNMKRLLSLSFAALLLGAVPSFAESVEGILMDNACTSDVQKKGFAAAKEHGKDCALMDSCKESGFAVVTPDGKVLKLDAKGNQMAVKALEGASKTDNLTVKVDGKISGASIAVSALDLT